ncbi:MAG: DUF2973 domain-containing protein [Cyanobacteria bacterium P01_A01_bin.135]
MLHLLYVLAFTALASIAIANLIKNLMVLGSDSQRGYRANSPQPRSPQPSHPELLDESGNVIREAYLVMKSMSVEDARDRLNSLYDASPSVSVDQPNSGDDPEQR